MIYKLKRQKEDERDFLYADKMMKAEKLPSSVDIRHECPAVFDQGQLGSCSANAGCANLVMLLKAPVILSRLYMYYKERELEGSVSEDSGAQMRDICKVAAKGVCEDKYMPYVIKDFAKAPSAEAVSHATFKAGSYHRVRDLQEIKHVLAIDKHPVLMGMEVFSSFESEAVAANGIVPMPTPGDQKLGGHAVLIVGYDDTKKCLIVRNSWGENWGDKGYFYLPYQFVINGFAFDFWELEL